MSRWFSASTSEQRIAQIAGVATIIAGCLVLIGWSFNLALIKTVLPGAAAMKANTALCFVLAGISLLMQIHHPQKTRIAKGCAIAVGTVGFLTLCQYFFGWNLGIDQLLFQDTESPATLYPGRMGDNTALNFLLIGVALFQRGKKSDHAAVIVQIAVLSAAAIALLSVMGYTYNVQIFYRFVVYSTSMAIHTALTFLGLSIGILASRADYQVVRLLTQDASGSRVIWQLLPVVIALPLGLGWLILQGLQANLYNAAFSQALLALSLTLILALILYQTAARLNRVDDDRRRSDDRLRSSEERWHLAIQGTQDGIWDNNLSTHEVYISPRCREVLGYLEHELQTFEAWKDCIHLDELAEMQTAMQAHLRGEIPYYSAEYRMRCRDGSYRWIASRGQAQWDQHGRPTRIIGSMTDIHDRKQAQLNDQFLNTLDLRLRKLPNAEAMEWETVCSLGEYLKVDRATWFDVDWKNRLAKINRDWHQEGLSSHSGTYAIADFISPELEADHLAGEAIVIADVTTHRDTLSRVATYQQLNMAAFVTIPCIQNGQWVAGLHLNTRSVRDWRSHEVTLLQETVARLWSIIEQTKAVQALSEQEERTRLATEAAEIGMWFWDVIQDELVWTNRAKALFGVAIEAQISYAVFLDVLHPDDRDRVHTAVMRSLDEQNEYTIEYRAVWADGSIHWISAKGHGFYNAAGQPLRMMGTVQDISKIKREESERLQAQAEIEERSTHIQLLYETTRALLSTEQPLQLVDSIFRNLKALIGLDVYFNYLVDDEKQKLHLTFCGGISDEMATSIEWLDFGCAICGTVAQERRQIVQPHLQQCEDPKAALVKSMGLNAYSCQPLQAQGRLFGTLGFGSYSRTSFTSAETKLFRAVCDQIAIALERSDLFTSLQQQTQELIQTNRLKDEFLAALSHELRTPLNPILGWTKMMQGSRLTPVKQTEALGIIERNVKQQIALVDDLLDMSRVIQGQFKLNLQSIDLALVLAQAIETIVFSAQNKHIEIAQSGLDSLSMVGDRDRLQQVFWNLLSNAIKFTQENGQVSVILSANGNGSAQVQVIDNGIGVAPEFIPHVFDSFRQADGSSTRKYGGLGLGLAIVRHLVELHGGTVTVESPGIRQGATFTVNLPLTEISLSEATSEPLRTNTATTLVGKRILLVEDDPDNLELLCFLLQEYDAIVTPMTSPLEALDFLMQNPIDLIVSDIGMPDLNGYEFIQQVRTLPQGNRIPAISLTAFAQAEDQASALSAGFQAYITKPVDPLELMTALTQLSDEHDPSQ